MPGTLLTLPQVEVAVRVVPRAVGQTLGGPHGPKRASEGGHRQGPPTPLPFFLKIVSKNQNVTCVRFQECRFPSLMLSPSQPPSSLALPHPSLQSTLLPWSHRTPRTALCRGWAGGWGAVQGCLPSFTGPGWLEHWPEIPEWRLPPWLRRPDPQLCTLTPEDVPWGLPGWHEAPHA